MIDYFAKRFEILGVKFSAITLGGACEIIADLIEQRKKGYIIVCPVSTIMECQKDMRLKSIVNAADVVTTDGMPSVWIGKLKGYKNVERVYGPDLMLAVCNRGQEKGWRHYLYGGTEEACEKLELALRKKFPKIQIAGRYSPPFRELDPDERSLDVEKIEAVSPDVVWVGLGSPKQDFWISKNRETLSTPLLIGVGAAFDFLSGIKKQAPLWMQQCGLEWLFRLCCEPKRLWRRYLIGNTKFVYYLMKDSFIRIFARKASHAA